MEPISILLLMAAAMVPVVVFMRRLRRSSGSAPNPAIFLVIPLTGIAFLYILRSAQPDAIFMRILILALAAVGFITLWVRELIHLMGLADDAFPGRHDKVLWFALLLCLPPIGTVTFGLFRRAYWPAHKPSLDSVASDLA